MIELLLQAEGALSVGLLDRAETLYQQVASADPRNSIAVVGLARVALERRDETGALALARQAQAIDPENTAAQRMVERLEEVLRYRGDEVPVAFPPEPAQTPSPEPAQTPSPEPAQTPSPEPAQSSPLQPEPPATSEPEPPSSKQRAPSAASQAPRRRTFVDRLLRRR